MFIAYNKKDGSVYAHLAVSKREGKTVRSIRIATLGRVLDKERGIYRSRERGVFTYDLATNTYGPAPEDFEEPPKRKRDRYSRTADANHPRLCLEVGPSYFLDQFLQKIDFYPVIDAIGFRGRDTLRCLVFYYLFSDTPNSFMKSWYDVNYAKVLFPHAAVSSREISKELAAIGEEDSFVLFFWAYYAYLKQHPVKRKREEFRLDEKACKKGAILTDLAGMPDSAHCPLAESGSRKESPALKLRMLYVCQEGTGLPLSFSYIPDNAADDASPIEEVVMRLARNGMRLKLAVLEHGFYCGENADALIEDKIPFVSLVSHTHPLFQEAVASHRLGLECQDNFVICDDRFFFLKPYACVLGKEKDKTAYAFLGLSQDIENQEMTRLHERLSDESVKDSQIFDLLNGFGLFLVTASQPFSREMILSSLRLHQQAEEVFHVDKRQGKPVPLSEKDKKTLRGHLLLAFLAAVIRILIEDRMKDKAVMADDIFKELRHQQGIVYEDALVPSLATEQMKAIYQQFEIPCPGEVPLPVSERVN